MCPWCYTGQRNRNSNNQRGFISSINFKKAIIYMVDNNIMNKSSIINLYNLGEPFLNPYLKEIINILNDYDIKYTLSTNASKVAIFSEKNVLRNLDCITFSMSGFSQSSYDKIHGFNFERIKKNIVDILNNFRACGFKGIAQISYHVYQFNLMEVEDAYKFACQNKLGMCPVYAFLNGQNMFAKYFKSELTYEEMKKASQELVLYYIDDKLKERPENYKCPQFDMLTLDENCNVLTCCGVGQESSDYSIGNLFELSLNEIKKLKLTRGICRECNETGLNYISHNPQPYSTKYIYKYKVIKQILTNIFDDVVGKNIGIYGTGTHTDKMLQMYQELFGPFKCNLFFFEPSEEKWGKRYHSGLISSPQDMEKCNLDRVIISSYTFQAEIYNRIKSIENLGVKVVKIYDENDAILF
jgi:MoaA/NifB/PqqE/SkfB family radical SAM enzyme